MDSDYCLVLSSCPDDATASRLAEALVDQGLAACVSILSGMTSIYRWQGQVERGQEALMLIKTRSERFEMLQAYLVDHHPYEVPEIIAVPVTAGLPAYLGWIDQSTAARETP